MITNLTSDRETVDAYLRLTGRAFESGAARLFDAAQSLICNSETVEQYCDRIVAEQVSVRRPRKIYPELKLSATL